MRTLGLYALCAAAAIAPWVPVNPGGREPADNGQPELPASFQKMRRLPLMEKERAFAAEFPGAIFRLTDGNQEWILRWIREPSRRVHPAAECFRASGYQVRPLSRDERRTGHEWNCFAASREGRNWRVCEQIVDHQGRAYPEVASWYWSSILGRSTGPWWGKVTAQEVVSFESMDSAAGR